MLKLEGTKEDIICMLCLELKLCLGTFSPLTSPLNKYG